MKMADFCSSWAVCVQNDYRVSGMFETDFEFNLFGKQSVSVVSRRAMLHLANYFSAISFPLHSSSAKA